MSSRAHLYRSATDNSGNIVPQLTVAVYEPGSTTLLAQPLYIDAVSSVTLSNPFTTSTGIIDFYLDDAATVKLGVTGPSGIEIPYDNIEITPPPENTVLAATSFDITNGPALGQFLQCTAPGEAAWVSADDLVSTKASPLSQLKNYDFSASSISDLGIADANGNLITPTFVSTTGDTLPPGYTFTKAMRLPVSSTIAVRIPPQLFPERGEVFFLYKIVGASSGAGAATVQLIIDSNLITVKTPTNPELMNVWVVGYLGDIPPGTHSIKFLHVPGTDTTSYVELGPITVQYGNNIPFHTHQGNGNLSTVLGPGAAANQDRTTVIGGLGQSLGVDATVVGASGSAEAQGTALGSTAYAASSGVAIGYYARTAPGTFGGVAIGEQANVTADNGVAAGASSQTTGARALAAGPSSAAAGIESVALGYQASAQAQGAVAIGSGAVVASGHTNSVALGPGAATTAPNQAMIGDASTTVTLPGPLTSSGMAKLGGETGTVGFYGSAGTTRPTITGSRRGNTTLQALLTALDALGLIKDQTVA